MELIIDNPIVVQPILARQIGLNESIVLQALRREIECNGVVKEDNVWIQKSLEQWQQQMNWWSVMTIKRAFDSLKKSNIVNWTTNFNSDPHTEARWYCFTHDAVERGIWS